jgi:hypothetical protein
MPRDMDPMSAPVQGTNTFERWYVQGWSFAGEPYSSQAKVNISWAWGARYHGGGAFIPSVWAWVDPVQVPEMWVRRRPRPGSHPERTRRLRWWGTALLSRCSHRPRRDPCAVARAAHTAAGGAPGGRDRVAAVDVHLRPEASPDRLLTLEFAAGRVGTVAGWRR